MCVGILLLIVVIVTPNRCFSNFRFNNNITKITPPPNAGLVYIMTVFKVNSDENSLQTTITIVLEFNLAHRRTCTCLMQSLYDIKWFFVQGYGYPVERITNITYLLTPWCRVLLEKLTGLQLVKKFPAFHGTRRFITANTSVRHLSLSWASPIQSIYPHPTSWKSIQILSTHLRLGFPSGLLPSSFPTKTLYTPLSSPIRATCLAHLILLDFSPRTEA